MNRQALNTRPMLLKHNFVEAVGELTGAISYEAEYIAVVCPAEDEGRFGVLTFDDAGVTVVGDYETLEEAFLATNDL